MLAVKKYCKIVVNQIFEFGKRIVNGVASQLFNTIMRVSVAYYVYM